VASGSADHGEEIVERRLASPGGIRFAADEVLAIDAYRCPDCGRIELFALRPPSSP
jgi:hypothetical protein